MSQPTTDWVKVTRHAGRRWHERTTDPGIGPRVAWETAKPVNPQHLHGDEIRYHAGTNLYLVAKSGRLVTVVPADRPDAPRPGQPYSGSEGIDA